MDAVVASADRFELVVSKEELLTLYHSLVEALEALSDAEFKIRTGGDATDARRMKEELKIVCRSAT